MGRVFYSINITVDGCVDHTMGIPDGETHAYATAIIARADAIVLGRITYGLMEGGWRSVAEAGVQPDGMPDWVMPFARTIHAARKYVVSDTLESVDWNGAELVRGADLIATVERLKRDLDNVYVGGAALPLTLADHGLIDEYEFIVHPRIAGRGPTLFAGLSAALDLKLVGRHDFASGCVALKYEPKR